jgi:hypothetical protein
VRDDAKATPTRAEVERLERRINELRAEKVSGLNGGIAAVDVAIDGRGVEAARIWARGAARAIVQEEEKGPIDWKLGMRLTVETQSTAGE